MGNLRVILGIVRIPPHPEWDTSCLTFQDSLCETARLGSTYPHLRPCLDNLCYYLFTLNLRICYIAL